MKDIACVINFLFSLYLQEASQFTGKLIKGLWSVYININVKYWLVGELNTTDIWHWICKISVQI